MLILTENFHAIKVKKKKPCISRELLIDVFVIYLACISLASCSEPAKRLSQTNSSLLLHPDNGQSSPAKIELIEKVGVETKAAIGVATTAPQNAVADSSKQIVESHPEALVGSTTSATIAAPSSSIAPTKILASSSPLLSQAAAPVLTTSTTTGAPQISTSANSIPLAYVPLDEDLQANGPCSLRTVTRKSLVISGPRSEISERALSCVGIDDKNYLLVVQSIHRMSKLDHIDQLHITSSESLVVFSAIDLICGRFDCSGLALFNVTGQKIYDYKVLSTWISSWPHLEVVDLSNTSIVALESITPTYPMQQVILKNLTHIYLDYNNISELNFNFILERMPSLRYLSLKNNSIFNITCNESLRSRVRSQFESISLAGNAINCDRSHLWFTKQFQVPLTNLKFPDHDLINCSWPKKLAEMSWAQRISVLETKICNDCDCRLSKRNAIAVDCHKKGLVSLPDVLPLNTKILNLTNNRIETIGRPTNPKNWENVSYLHLEDNLITSFQPWDFNSKFLRDLVALDIRKNKFQGFPIHIFEQFNNLDRVHLSDNPWVCDCEMVRFQEFLERRFQQVVDKEDVKCGVAGSDENGLSSNGQDQRLSGQVIYKLSKSDLCPQEDANQPATAFWLDVINGILIILILVIVFKTLIDYNYQQRTRRLPHFFKINI